jgi:flagellin
MTFTIKSALPGFVMVDMDLAPIISKEAATEWITYVDEAIGSIDSIRSTLGAVQNRLTSTVSNLQSISENISAARSQITDADYAAETSNMTKAQILQQAGVAMLSQTNQLPQAVLSLLQG